MKPVVDYAARATIAEQRYREQCAIFNAQTAAIYEKWGADADTMKRKDQRRKDAADAAAWARDEATMYALLAMMARPS